MYNPQTPLLDIQDLSVRLRTPGGTHTVLDRVSLQLAAGQTLGLVGESGCGKSVTAMAVMRLLPRAQTIYAGGRIPWFWIVNVRDKIVEVYTAPKSGASPEYRKRQDYKMGDKVPVFLSGKTVGHVEVSKLFPDDAD